MNLSRTWTMWIVRGIASIAFGVYIFARPAASISTLVFLFGAYALADGALLLGFGTMTKQDKARYFGLGLISIAAGVFAFMRPGLTALSLYFLIGGWAIALGIAELAFAAAVRKQAPVGGLVLAGALSIACGVALFALPAAGVVALLGVIAAYAIVNGITLVAAGVSLRNLVLPA